MAEDIIYGFNPVLEALRGKRQAFELFLTEGNDRRQEKVLALAKERGVAVRRREKKDISRLTGTEHHQGVALRLEGFPYTDLQQLLDTIAAKSGTGLVVVLDGIQDPHNLGAIIRSAACAGADGVIIPRDRAVGVTPVVEKASAGAAETVPVVQVTNIAQTLATLKEADFWIYGASQESDATIYDQQLSGSIALVIGGEGEGIRPLVRKGCDVLAAIPLQGGVQSLNASVAAGIFLFEVVRQRLP
ncbi:MAG TPA: 23S rRNA (guanosine(2251)-2'-O)-methyltransferase RlmB, partial [Geobacterales bacterium]|nr:23S rRNA (guanosine(2251)-2'-O)-methyltransferase RlmB [Geobacterales bacterium]